MWNIIYCFMFGRFCKVFCNFNHINHLPKITKIPSCVLAPALVPGPGRGTRMACFNDCWNDRCDGPASYVPRSFWGLPRWVFFHISLLKKLLSRSIGISRLVFSCDQAALWMVFSVRLSVCLSVCPSVRLSVCPSVRLSVCHTFLTMFPSSYHHEIFRSYHIGPG